MALNKVDLMGRLVADPDYKKVGSDEIPLVNFRIAVDRDYINKATNTREADFINCVAFRSTANFVAQYFAKGDMIVVSGRLQSRTYQAQDGSNRSTVEVSCDNCYFGGPKSSDRAEGDHQGIVNDTEDIDLPF